MSVRQIVGLVLVVIGIVALVWGGVFWTDRDTILDAGPLEVATKNPRVWRCLLLWESFHWSQVRSCCCYRSAPVLEDMASDEHRDPDEPPAPRDRDRDEPPKPDMPDTPPTEPERVPVEEPPPAPDKQGPYVVAL